MRIFIPDLWFAPRRDRLTMNGPEGEKKEGAGGPICSDLQNRRPFIIMVIITQIEKPQANNVTLLFQATCNGVCSCHVKAC